MNAPHGLDWDASLRPEALAAAHETGVLPIAPKRFNPRLSDKAGIMELLPSPELAKGYGGLPLVP
jgi:hypothetical protein